MSRPINNSYSFFFVIRSGQTWLWKTSAGFVAIVGHRRLMVDIYKKKKLQELTIIFKISRSLWLINWLLNLFDDKTRCWFGYFRARSLIPTVGIVIVFKVTMKQILRKRGRRIGIDNSGSWGCHWVGHIVWAFAMRYAAIGLGRLLLYGEGGQRFIQLVGHTVRLAAWITRWRFR